MDRISTLALLIVLLAVSAVAPLTASSISVLCGDRSEIVALAESYLGVPYRYGGVGRGGVDCSGLVCKVFEKATSLPRTVAGQINAGEAVKGAIRAGDLLFFDTVGGPSHVGIAIDADRFVHAASDGPRTGVIISSLSESYYKTRFLQARSVLGDDLGTTGFLFEIDGGPVSRTVAGGVAAGTPITISVRSHLPGSRFVSLVARRDGSIVFTKRIRVRSGVLSTPIRLVPDQGNWELALNAGRRSAEGPDLAVLSFRAGAES